MITIKTDSIEFEIIPEISIFMGIKDERGIDIKSELREWNDLTPIGEDTIKNVLKELRQILSRLESVLGFEELERARRELDYAINKK